MAHEIEKYLPYCKTWRQQEVVNAIIKEGSHRKAAKALGVGIRNLDYCVARIKKQAKNQGFDPSGGLSQGVPQGIGWARTSTLRDYRENPEGDKLLEWVITRPDQENAEEAIREAVKALAEELPKLPKRKNIPKFNKKLMSVIPFGDPHFGMYSWAEETGHDFDTDIARRDLCSAVDYLVSQSPASERCVIMSLGDFFHADNLEGKTTRSGNVLDMDTRLPRVIRIGVSAMRQAVESALSRHKTVEVVCAIGNHDDVLSMALSILLSHVYENEPRVIIHDSPTRRHYIRHGKVLIGVTHGDRTKDKDLLPIMASEKAEDWGNTKHRYFYRGHHHHSERNEFHGGIVEQFRTLAPPDAWHSAGGYMAGRDMSLIVHHEDYGEVQRSICSIDMLK